MANLAEGQRLFFFLFQRQFGDLPLEPQQDQRRQTELSSSKVLVLTLRLGVDFSRWTDTWCGTGGLLCKPDSHGKKSHACGFSVSCVFGNYFTVPGWMFKFRDVRWVEKYGVCVAANHLPSSFYMQRCHSQLQIKHSCFREIMVLLYILFQGGGIQIWSVFAVFIVKFLSPAALHLLYVCFFFQVQLWKLNRQQWDTSIKCSTLCCSLCSHTVCVGF